MTAVFTVLFTALVLPALFVAATFLLCEAGLRALTWLDRKRSAARACDWRREAHGRLMATDPVYRHEVDRWNDGFVRRRLS